MSAEQNLQYGVRVSGEPPLWASTEGVARAWLVNNKRRVLVAREVGEPFVVREPLPDVEGTVIWAKYEGSLVIAVLSDPGTEVPWLCSSTAEGAVRKVDWATPDELELVAVVPAPEVES